MSNAAATREVTPDIRMFVCYRRRGDNWAVGRMCDRLRREFGDASLFIDVDGIPYGDDWRDVLEMELKKTDVLLVLITDQWLGLQGEGGRRKLDAKDDFVRIEIEMAIERNIPIIPILFDSAAMPTPEHLPPSIKKLAYRQGRQLRAADFTSDIAALVESLRKRAASLQWVRKERNNLLTLIERGDWLLARQLCDAALRDAPDKDTSEYRALELLKQCADSLALAAQAFERNDFNGAATALATVMGTHALQIVGTSMELARIGARLAEETSIDIQTYQALEMQVSTLCGPDGGGSTRVPGRREVREFLQRVHKGAGYQEALRCYEAGHFTSAANQFERLEDFRDSKDRLTRCKTWLEVLRLIAERRWDAARLKARVLAAGEDEDRSRAIQKWCVFARQVVPILEALTTGLVPEEHVPWEGGPMPYCVLRVPPTLTATECKALSFDLQSKPGGMTAEERAAWDSLRLTEQRLLVDFALYCVKSPSRAQEVLNKYFVFDVSSPDDILAQIRAVVDQASGGASSERRRTLLELVAPEVAEDAGILHALAGDYDGAIFSFRERALRAPYDSIALHHLGLAACAKAHLESDGDNAIDAWETLAFSWAAVFADGRFWRSWWAQRRRVYQVPDEEHVFTARMKLQRYWTEEIKSAAAMNSSLGDVFRTELHSARVVEALGGIPFESATGGSGRVVVGPEAASQLRITEYVTDWIAKFPIVSVETNCNERKVCIGFSRLAAAQTLIDENRFAEAISVLQRLESIDAATFRRDNLGFASIPGRPGRQLFIAARQSLRQAAHAKLALAAVSELPVDVDNAIEHWRLALSAAPDNSKAVLDEIRDVVIGRCQVLRNNDTDGRLDALNDAVRLIQDVLDQHWHDDEEGLTQSLVDSLLDRAIYLSNKYDLEKEAREDAARAWALAPGSLRAIIVLCMASLYYARELNGKNERGLAQALSAELQVRLRDAAALFPGNTDLLQVSRKANEVAELLRRNEGGLEQALEGLRRSAADTPAGESDSRLAQAMVFQAQNEFPRATALYWELLRERPTDKGLLGKLGYTYRVWISQLMEHGPEEEYNRVLREAAERCPESAALVDIPVDRAGGAETQDVQ